MDLLSLTLTVFAFLTSALSGLAGMGGGTILIGVFFALGLTPVEAVPLFAAVQFVSNSSRTIAYIRHVEWHGAAWFTLALVPATFLLAPFAEDVNPNVVLLILAGLILASLVPTHDGGAPLPPRASFITAGVLNGSIGMFIGATGLFVGRLFLRPEWRKETTIATLAFTQVIGHGLRVIAYGFVGYSALASPALLIPLCLAVIAGTWTGKHLNGRISEERFAGLFKAILGILSMKLLYDAARGFGWI